MVEGEWIEHHGKGYPDLPMDTLVQVRFADGDTSMPHGQTVEYWSVSWMQDTPTLYRADITHYRVVKP